MTGFDFTHPDIRHAEAQGYGPGFVAETEPTRDEEIESLWLDLQKEITLANYRQFAEYYPAGTFDPVTAEIDGDEIFADVALFFALEKCAEYDFHKTEALA